MPIAKPKLKPKPRKMIKPCISHRPDQTMFYQSPQTKTTPALWLFIPDTPNALTPPPLGLRLRLKVRLLVRLRLRLRLLCLGLGLFVGLGLDLRLGAWSLEHLGHCWRVRGVGSVKYKWPKNGKNVFLVRAQNVFFKLLLKVPVHGSLKVFFHGLLEKTCIQEAVVFLGPELLFLNVN